jgi:hypothetical protein
VRLPGHLRQDKLSSIANEGILHKVKIPLLPTGEVSMQVPLTEPDTLCEELVPELPSETVQMARTCKAWVRAKKVTPPAPLLRVVCFYCGLDHSLREVAGTLTAL